MRPTRLMKIQEWSRGWCRASVPLLSWHIDTVAVSRAFKSCHVIQASLRLMVLSSTSVSQMLELQVCMAPGLSRVLYWGLTSKAWLTNQTGNVTTPSVFLVTSLHHRAISGAYNEPNQEYNKDISRILRVWDIPCWEPGIKPRQIPRHITHNRKDCFFVLTENFSKTMMRQPPKTRMKFYYVQFIEAGVVLFCTK